MTAWLALLVRELRLLARHGADTLAAVLFFVVAGSLFPLAIGPAPETLGRMAPCIVWVCALLAALPENATGDRLPTVDELMAAEGAP